MADQHFSDFSELLAAGWTGAEEVEAAGLFDGQNVKFPVVVNGISGATPTNAEMKGGNSLADGSAQGVNISGGDAPGAGNGGDVEIKGGDSDSGSSGNVRIHAGTSTSGAQGFAQLGKNGSNYVIASADEAALAAAGGVNYISVTAAGIFLGGLLDFADDAAAATGGLSIGAWYRTGSVTKVRVS